MARFSPRFQTGTLGRSVRRFGRFPRFGRTGFQRKKFAHFYASVNGQLELTSPPDAFVASMVNQTDLVPTASVAVGAQLPVNNVSIDAILSLQLTPDAGALSAFGTLGVLWGIYKQDVDEGTQTIDQVFATNSLIKWGRWTVQAVTANGSAAGWANPTLVQTQRVRFRVSKLNFDEELLFIANWDDTLAPSQFDLAQITINERVRYEVP